MAKPKFSASESSSLTPLPVLGISGRATNGVSRPWLVEAADGYFYFLKRDNVTRDELAMEFLMSRLAEEYGLPVPPVRLLELPESLLAHSSLDEIETLSPGVAFGSRRIDFAEEIRSFHLHSIDVEIQLQCLCFDWWTRNPDRRLSRTGGDPNLLWDPILEQVLMIDFDRCLDPDFDPVAFKQRHAFRDALPYLERTFIEKWRTRFESAIYGLNKIWDEMPREWLVGSGKRSLLSFTRPDLEARLIKPKLSPDGLLTPPLS